jgi:peptidoglycan/xylan/chitin deacetylase (PgdA/CDA1 family)
MIIMFHRIANQPRCCPIERFEHQVKFAKKIGATLTFDDGLKEHHTIALPILKKYDMKGYFFVITNSQKQMAPAHKIWLLLDRADTLIEQFDVRKEKFLPSNWYVYDSVGVANLKFYFNTHQEDLDQIFGRYFDEQEEIEKLYMNWDEISELHENGMRIGNHTHTHPILSNLSNEDQENEIRLSTNIIKKRIQKPIAFAYPLGMYNEFTLELLKKYRYRLAVTVEPEDLLLLRRIDTNEFY